MEGRHLLWSQPALSSIIPWGKLGFKGNCPRESLEGSSNMLLDFSWRVFSKPWFPCVQKGQTLCRWVACESQFKYGGRGPTFSLRFTGLFMESATVGEAEVVRASQWFNLEVGHQWGYLLLLESILRARRW